MPYVLVRHKVEDYTTWKPMFDEGEMGRRAVGSKGGYVFRNADDANEVFILMEVTDLEQARQAARSEEMRQSLQRAGVADQPDLYFLEEVDRPAA